MKDMIKKDFLEIMEAAKEVIIKMDEIEASDRKMKLTMMAVTVLKAIVIIGPILGNIQDQMRDAMKDELGRADGDNN